MNKKRHILLIFNLENVQHHYATCMEFILAIEHGYTLENPERINAPEKENILSVLSLLELKGDLIPPDNHKKEVNWITEIEKKNTSFRSVDIPALIETSSKNTGTYVFYYYLRIQNTQNSDVAEFFYYELLLQARKFPNDRTFAYIIPKDDTRSDYYRFSHFTMLLSSKYNNVFSSYTDQMGFHIEKLSKDDNTASFLPIIEINEISFRELQLNRSIVYSSFDEDPRLSLSNWITSISPNNCENKMILQLFRLTNSLIAKAFSGKIRSDSRKKEVSDSLISAIEESSGISALQYLIFGINLNEYITQNLNDTTWALDCLLNSYEFVDGITQLLENIVHHSSQKKGLFAIRIHDYNEQLKYLSNANTTFSVSSKASDKQRIMQILIADNNQDHSIVSTFLSKQANTKLHKVADKITISDFFGEYSQGAAAEYWNAFRNENPTQCQGLLKFKNAAESIESVIEVHSGTQYQDSCQETQWCRDFRSKKQAVKYHRSEDCVFIPGTQIVIKVPMKKLVFSRTTHRVDFSPKSVFSKSFISYAAFLDYHSEVVTFDKLLEYAKEIASDSSTKWFVAPYGDQKSKNQKSKYWEDTWDKALESFPNEKIVYILDLEKLSGEIERREFEPFCKGFLSSKWVNKGETENTRYIMFINHDSPFQTTFLSTAAADPNVLAQNNLQVWLAGDGKNVSPHPILGETIENVRTNLQEYLHMDTTYSASDPTNTDIPKAPINMFPFEVFAPETFPLSFEYVLKQHASNDLAPESKTSAFGYRLSNTHMRLGNKVHIDTFFEIAPYFIRERVALDTGFLLLQQLLKQPEFIEATQKECAICFYGYASYSRAIINAMMNILSYYKQMVCLCKEKEKSAEPCGKNTFKASLAFIIYQTQQSGELMSNEEEIYVSDKKLLRDTEKGDIAIVQIVPISTTLTTFKKMWNKLNDWNLNHGKSDIFQLPETPLVNQTVLWVRDSQSESSNEISDPKVPSAIEVAYWEKTDGDTCNRKIVTKDKIIQSPMFIMYQGSYWRDPLTCEKCFPEKRHLEFPLVETDDSSTVPSQQVFRAEEQPDSRDLFVQDNEDRIAEMQQFVKYGHIVRGSNHFQYYIDMQRYFRAQQDDIRKWLEGFNKSDYIQELFQNIQTKRIYIVSPQKPNNVEFSQFVNNYCFSGLARMIFIDSEKNFRSNIKAEFFDYGTHATDDDNYYYVDASIGTGHTFQHISSLMNSIVPKRKGGSFSFKSVFVLVSRLSNASKEAFVSHPSKNFFSYVQLNISNMRTYGDSCVGCKLKSEAKHFYKLAATKQISEYWQGKIFKNDTVQHHKWKAGDSSKQSKGFSRMVCTHRATTLFSPVRGHNISAYFGVINALLEEGLEFDDRENPDKTSVLDYIGQSNVGSESLFISYIKVLSRPFFTYDYKIKCCMVDILAGLLTLILNNCTGIDSARELLPEDEKKAYLYGNDELKWIFDFQQNVEKVWADASKKREFIRVLLKALANMHSNYIIRKQTIVDLNSYLISDESSADEYAEFMHAYLRYILRVTHSGSDERNGLWLECLLLNHDEHGEKPIGDSKDLMVNFGVQDDYTSAFQSFYNTLVLENGHVLFSGIKTICKELPRLETQPKEKNCNRSEEAETQDTCEHPLAHILKESHMWDFCRFVLLNNKKSLPPTAYLAHKKLEPSDFRMIEALSDLLSFLSKEPSKEGGRYTKLQEILVKIVKNHYPEEESIVAICAESDTKSDYLNFGKYFCVAPTKEKDEKLIVEDLDKILTSKGEKELDSNSFYIESGYIIVKLDNNYNCIEEFKADFHGIDTPTIQKMEPVYLFIKHSHCKENGYDTLLLVRKILMFRNHLIAWLERDFLNGTMTSLSRIRRTAKLLTSDKAGYHSDISDTDALQNRLMREPFPDSICLEEIQKPDFFKGIGKEDILEAYYSLGDASETNQWLLLHSYVNTKIARLYRAMVNVEELGEKIKFDNLYRYKGSPAKNHRKALLENIGKSLNKSIVPQYELKAKDHTLILDEMSRKHYFTLLFQVMQFYVDGEFCEDFDVMVEKLSGYNCITVPIDGQSYGYCEEQITCLLLDYCISAIKYGFDWDTLPNVRLWLGSAGRMRYLKMNNASENFCVNIKRVTGGEPASNIYYDYLELSNRSVVKTNETGLSSLSTRWYVENLWKKYVEKNSLANKDMPRVTTSNDENTYTLRLPILESEEKRGE